MHPQSTIQRTCFVARGRRKEGKGVRDRREKMRKKKCKKTIAKVGKEALLDFNTTCIFTVHCKVSAAYFESKKCSVAVCPHVPFSELKNCLPQPVSITCFSDLAYRSWESFLLALFSPHLQICPGCFKNKMYA